MADPVAIDTDPVRKARGAFFTPSPIARHIVEWAVRSGTDSVYEPSCGDAAFLVEAVVRLRALGTDAPVVEGVEIHGPSVKVAESAVLAAGGIPRIRHTDFFLDHPSRKYDAVVGNPPYIRYQEWRDESRIRSREAALSVGVRLSGLASSWASFAVKSASQLRDGGRLGLVLPAELLSVNYAAPVREFLFSSFASVDLVVFRERVFSEAEADVVLVLADGYRQGPARHATIHQADDADALSQLPPPRKWTPLHPGAKWTTSIAGQRAQSLVADVLDQGRFGTLQDWGETTLGMVTGRNDYFALSPQRVAELGLRRTDLIRLSPPGSAHLRGLVLSEDSMTRLGRRGKATWLFRPRGAPSPEALAYISAGHTAGVDQAYKTRIRKEWWRVPLLPPADLLLTCMNADTPRLTTNLARAHHLNSVHGVYLADDRRALAMELLPLASVNTLTMFAAETTGRAYGGGILKIEPREADIWAMPSRTLVATVADQLRAIRPRVELLLRYGRLDDAANSVDNILLIAGAGMTTDEIEAIRSARNDLVSRRTARAEYGKR